ncbi:MAG: hypothetical protein AABX12_02110 [Nanoarchaeota archaeon]
MKELIKPLENGNVKGGSENRMTRRELPEPVDRTFLGVPQSVTAAYENKWAGNLVAYPVDYDPIASDHVYKKLDDIDENPLYWNDKHSSFIRRSAGKVAFGLMKSMKARQMGERQYRHISSTPIWRLRLEFALACALNKYVGRQDTEDVQFRREMDLSEACFQRQKAIGAYLKPKF